MPTKNDPPNPTNHNHKKDFFQSYATSYLLPSPLLPRLSCPAKRTRLVVLAGAAARSSAWAWRRRSEYCCCVVHLLLLRRLRPRPCRPASWACSVPRGAWRQRDAPDPGCWRHPVRRFPKRCIKCKYVCVVWKLVILLHASSQTDSNTQPRMRNKFLSGLCRA